MKTGFPSTCFGRKIIGLGIFFNDKFEYSYRLKMVSGNKTAKKKLTTVAQLNRLKD